LRNGQSHYFDNYTINLTPFRITCWSTVQCLSWFSGSSLCRYRTGCHRRKYSGLLL